MSQQRREDLHGARRARKRRDGLVLGFGRGDRNRDEPSAGKSGRIEGGQLERLGRGRLARLAHESVRVLPRLQLAGITGPPDNRAVGPEVQETAAHLPAGLQERSQALLPGAGLRRAERSGDRRDGTGTALLRLEADLVDRHCSPCLRPKSRFRRAGG